jgi:hypothetical protein
VVLNYLIVSLSQKIIDEKGQKFDVKKCKQKSYNLGSCYPNSTRLMNDKKYKYVEGYVIKNGVKIGHSWNIDQEGNHIDFTFKNPQDFEYIGVVIPEKIVWEISKKNGNIWFCVLPFVDDI